MFNKLIIIGAGGQGKVVADIAIKLGYKDIAFIDDNAKGNCMGFPILGNSSIINGVNDDNTLFVIGIGKNEVRKQISEKYNLNYATLVHPSAQIGNGVEIGEGTVIMAGAVINAGAKIGRHCVINSTAVVEHDNRIDNYVHISPGALLGGTVSIGECTHIGIGAIIRNNITVCEDCVVGAGAVVVKNIIKSSVYIGIPAQMKK